MDCGVMNKFYQYFSAFFSIFKCTYIFIIWGKSHFSNVTTLSLTTTSPSCTFPYTSALTTCGLHFWHIQLSRPRWLCLGQQRAVQRGLFRLQLPQVLAVFLSATSPIHCCTNDATKHPWTTTSNSTDHPVPWAHVLGIGNCVRTQPGFQEGPAPVLYDVPCPSQRSPHVTPFVIENSNFCSPKVAKCSNQNYCMR